MHTAEHQHTVYAHIGQRIRDRRKRLKLNQTDLAGMMGFSYQQMQKYEAGNSKVSAGKLLLFAKILNVPPSYFYDGIRLEEELGRRIETHVIQKNRGRALRILLVDHNPADVLSFQKALSAHSESVDTVVMHDAESAIGYLQNQDARVNRKKPDIVVMEIGLPNLGGLELLKFIKRHSATAGLPVIVLTNSVKTVDLSEAYRRGAAGFVQKSVDPQEYADSVGSIVKYWSKTVALPNP